MKTRRSLMLMGLAVLGFSLSAQAEDLGTRDEAKAMVDKAVAHAKKVGAEQAFKDFMSDKAQWTYKDLYVFATGMNGVMLSNGSNDKLVGKNLLELKDQNGKTFVKDYLALAQSKGAGWTDYDWVHPQTKKIEKKASYVRKLDNFEAVVGVGVYR